MDAYPLPARPLPVGHSVAPIVDLRGGAVDMHDAAALSPWSWCIEYARRAVAATADVADDVVQEPIKGLDRSSGSDSRQLARVLAALDDGRPVAFYGWWPTAETASVSDILGVDAMDVPTPDRKGSGLADGHAVVAVGYGRHDAFPGGGYLIVRNPWAGDWGDGGDGYLPFTYVRAYAIALTTHRRGRGHTDGDLRDVSDEAGPPAIAEPVIDSPPSLVEPIDRVIRQHARCFDPRSSLTDLFFSEDPMDTARAKAICARCSVRELCLSRALQRREPYGVWGGQFLIDGAIVELKRGRGRPRKVPLPTVVDEVTGMPIVA